MALKFTEKIRLSDNTLCDNMCDNTTAISYFTHMEDQTSVDYNSLTREI